MSFLNDSVAELRHESPLVKVSGAFILIGDMRLTSNALVGRHVLILEDEYLIAMDVEQLCRDAGAAEVTIAHSLSDAGAVDGFAKRFDVVILDLMLSGLPTVDYARQLREAGVPFVFASGYAGNDEVFMHFPEVRVVAKPYSGSDLIEAVSSVLSPERRLSGV